jgi:hypothetical protein
VTRWLPLALLAAALAAAPAGLRNTPQALSVAPEARPGFRALWMASVAAKAERVACLASVQDGDTLRIVRILPIAAGSDSTAVSAGASLDRCGPPAWQGTVHTHIPLAEGQHPNGLFSGADRGVMLMWWQRWKMDGTFCLLYGEGQAHCEIDGSHLVILPSVRY